ncbi:SH3 domain-containing protein [Oceanobacillus neutriphilus]|uniref:SH3b domain-containing protein n=1 Tax=Oceanobacillus neutriphilus TaxID=531815 RepID=A0ABQ2NZ11_9BACI|nr:SH3 domain-containing protein [Oceanobacillus neutriphilus]GGP14137.1 hypothetical protein GCM10011346_36900 [Oceanobacillus neutriphilus]
MRKSSKFRLFLLFIAGIIFVVFVFIMQRQFNNPEFDYQNEVAGVSQSGQDDESEDTDTDDEEADTDDESEEEAENADEATDNSTEDGFQVTADLLNIRTGPNANSEVVATLVTGDIVQISSEQDEFGWVEITYQDVTGYANGEYLEPVDKE